MKNKKIMSDFLNSLNENGMLTDFFKIVFVYPVLNDYNYISRFVNEKNYLIIDIYDNILDNRFNRYIFDFKSNDYIIKVNDNDDVIVTYICVNSNYKASNNLMRLAYLFSDNNNNMIGYAKTFLPFRMTNLLKNIILKNKSI